MNLLRKAKISNFIKPNIKNLSDWKTVLEDYKTFLFRQNGNSNTIMRTEKKIVTGDIEISSTMNNYFTKVTKHVKLKPGVINQWKPLASIIDAFKNHESVQRIKLANFHSKRVFSFPNTKEEEEVYRGAS